MSKYDQLSLTVNKMCEDGKSPNVGTVGWHNAFNNSARNFQDQVSGLGLDVTGRGACAHRFSFRSCFNDLNRLNELLKQGKDGDPDWEERVENKALNLADKMKSARLGRKLGVI
jgi:hypothetical protein